MKSQSNKSIIFDASTLITLSMNGLLNELSELKKTFGGKFIITKQVKTEAIDNPMKIQRFQLEGMKLNEMLEDGILELPSSLGVDDKIIAKKTNEMLSMANGLFVSSYGKEIHLIDLGETSCLALSKILDEKGVKNVIAIDERTTRSLSETPDELKNFLEGKLHTKISSKKESVDFFKKFRFIRSIELMYVAYKKGILKIKNDNRLKALLYALKYKGAAISKKEIQGIISLASGKKK